MRIALIGPSFFGYPDRIVTALHRLGHGAEHYDERPSNRVAVKLLIRLSPQRARAWILRRYHGAICARILAGGFSHVLVISPQILSPVIVRRFQAAGMKVVLYSWDSMRNQPQVRRLLPHVDRAASFDPADCRARGLDHIPLFGIPSAAAEAPPRAERPTDFLFCATMHSHRPRWLDRVVRAARRMGWRLETMTFYHSRPLWLVRNLARPDLWPHVRKIRTTAYSEQETQDAVARAKVVIDVPHPRQVGNTMRVFEALSLGAVVLSTNVHCTEGLPESFARRILPLRHPRETARCMAEALAMDPPPLSPRERAYLSIDRFAGQMVELLARSRSG